MEPDLLNQPYNPKEDSRFHQWIGDAVHEFQLWALRHAVVLEITNSTIFDPDCDDIYDMHPYEEGEPWIEENLPDKGWDINSFDWAVYGGFKDPNHAVLFWIRWS